MKRHLPIPEDDIERRILQNVAAAGCHVIKVMEDESGPGFAYSVGLFHNYSHPEILIVGLELDLMHGIINNLRDDIRHGEMFQAHTRVPGILEGFDCIFRQVSRAHYAPLLGAGRWFYGGDEFPAIQCIWPDMEGNFPWEEKFDPELKNVQPIYDNSGDHTTK